MYCGVWLYMIGFTMHICIVMPLHYHYGYDYEQYYVYDMCFVYRIDGVDVMP